MGDNRYTIILIYHSPKQKHSCFRICFFMHIQKLCVWVCAFIYFSLHVNICKSMQVLNNLENWISSLVGPLAPLLWSLMHSVTIVMGLRERIILLGLKRTWDVTSSFCIIFSIKQFHVRFIFPTIIYFSNNVYLSYDYVFSYACRNHSPPRNTFQ